VPVVANLTIAVDDTVLKKARLRAVQHGTSVNAVLREYLEQYSGASEQADALNRIQELLASTHASSGPEGRTWTRDDLYDRPVLRDRANVR
jgi:plasmid stability protein